MICQSLTSRRATIDDLSAIVKLLAEDELGKTREASLKYGLAQCYRDAFNKINADPNQHLMVVEEGSELSKKLFVATCHLTLMPSLTLKGSTRLCIEAVRVAENCQGRGIGEWMIRQAFDYAKAHGASIVQLTTNKKRVRAKKFYERLGFEATHEGMKYYF